MADPVKHVVSVLKTALDQIQGNTGGGQKKVAPHKKWFTWIIMAINNKNVNKTNVVVFTCVAVCKPKQYL